MNNVTQVTDREIAQLAEEARRAGDYAQGILCDIALGRSPLRVGARVELHTGGTGGEDGTGTTISGIVLELVHQTALVRWDSGRQTSVAASDLAVREPTAQERQDARSQCERAIHAARARVDQS